jgi:hypothetical protein
VKCRRWSNLNTAGFHQRAGREAEHPYRAASGKRDERKCAAIEPDASPVSRF